MPWSFFFFAFSLGVLWAFFIFFLTDEGVGEIRHQGSGGVGSPSGQGGGSAPTTPTGQSEGFQAQKMFLKNAMLGTWAKICQNC